MNRQTFAQVGERVRKYGINDTLWAHQEAPPAEWVLPASLLFEPPLPVGDPGVGVPLLPVSMPSEDAPKDWETIASTFQIEGVNGILMFTLRPAFEQVRYFMVYVLWTRNDSDTLRLRRYSIPRNDAKVTVAVPDKPWSSDSVDELDKFLAYRLAGDTPLYVPDGLYDPMTILGIPGRDER